jgi:CRISPR-associated protein Csc2
MAILNNTWFPAEVPPKPNGHYAHIVMLRVTESYALFQTDGELNTARVRSGMTHAEPMTRIEIFKRKQTTPERLTGRELLRRYGFLSDQPSTDRRVTMDVQKKPICDYNEAFCMGCPDCICYGFAIGDSGSEKSKIIADTAFSLTDYAYSHESRTLNAPYEDGTMSRQGVVTSRINEQDHVRPGVIFPAIITAHDLSSNLFRYVLNNVIRTRHYGAQTTRTGTMRNHLICVVLSDGEIFSNLKFTQRLFDVLTDQGSMTPPDPVDLSRALSAAREVLPELLREDGVRIDQLIIGSDIDQLLAELRSDNGEQARELLAGAFQDSQAYYKRWIEKARPATRGRAMGSA